MEEGLLLELKRREEVIDKKQQELFQAKKDLQQHLNAIQLHLWAQHPRVWIIMVTIPDMGKKTLAGVFPTREAAEEELAWKMKMYGNEGKWTDQVIVETDARYIDLKELTRGTLFENVIKRHVSLYSFASSKDDFVIKACNRLLHVDKLVHVPVLNDAVILHMSRETLQQLGRKFELHLCAQAIWQLNEVLAITSFHGPLNTANNIGAYVSKQCQLSSAICRSLIENLLLERV